MEQRDAIAQRHVFSASVKGRGTCAPDLPRLLAVLAARQFVLPTVQAMRAGTSSAAPADRMVRLFARCAQASVGAGAAGAFNLGTAHYLSGANDDEAAVYRGA